MSYKRIGDLIKPVSNRNQDLSVKNLLGINVDKKFMPSLANTSGIDFRKYKVVNQGQFATNIMHVGRDERLPIALYNSTEPAIVSPAYITFEVIDKSIVLPEFLMIEFQRAEFDRLSWFNCDSSVRGGLEWDRFCEIKIPIPNIDEQLKYVAIYSGLLANQETYHKSLNDLQLICNSSMDKLKKIDYHLPLNKLIKLVDVRNDSTEIKKLLGINISKVFMPSKANVSQTDLSKYKIVKKDQFAYSAMQVGRDETVRVVLYSKKEPAIISPAYLVFEVIDKNVVIPEFLMLWFYRPEFNRYGWFISDSTVRASLEWDRFKEINIPIPDLKIQEAIVALYHTLESRKRIYKQLKETIKPLCPILMKGVMDSITTHKQEIELVY